MAAGAPQARACTETSHYRVILTSDWTRPEPKKNLWSRPPGGGAQGYSSSIMLSITRICGCCFLNADSVSIGSDLRLLWVWWMFFPPFYFVLFFINWHFRRCVIYKNIHDERLNLHFYQVRGKHDERDSEGVNLVQKFSDARRWILQELNVWWMFANLLLVVSGKQSHKSMNWTRTCRRKILLDFRGQTKWQTTLLVKYPGKPLFFPSFLKKCAWKLVENDPVGIPVSAPFQTP